MRHIPRREAIDTLRSRLTELVDDEHSICAVAGRRGIFCRGLRQWSVPELRQRFQWVAAPRPGIGRKELERLVNLYELAREEVHGLPLACDVHAVERDGCRGWDGFTNQQLSEFLAELGVTDARVVDAS